MVAEPVDLVATEHQPPPLDALPKDVDDDDKLEELHNPFAEPVDLRTSTKEALPYSIAPVDLMGMGNLAAAFRAQQQQQSSSSTTRHGGQQGTSRQQTSALPIPLLPILPLPPYPSATREKDVGVSEAETLLQAAKKDADVLEKKLNALVRRNRRVAGWG